jgi:hypothetical protein
MKLSGKKKRRKKQRRKKTAAGKETKNFVGLIFQVKFLPITYFISFTRGSFLLRYH